MLGVLNIGFVHYARGAALARYRAFGFITTVAVSGVVSGGGG